MLLPCLERFRITYALELAEVLKRKFPGGVREFDVEHLGELKCITSPIDKHTQKLSDKSWLSLIRDVSLCQGKWSHENWDKGTESTPEMFARSFSDAAEKNPLRFAKLALAMPGFAYDEFKEGIVRAACKSPEVPLKLACDVIRRLCKRPSRNVAVALSWTVKARAGEDWPEDILDILSDTAANHPDPEKGSMPVQSLDHRRGNATTFFRARSTVPEAARCGQLHH